MQNITKEIDKMIKISNFIAKKQKIKQEKSKRQENYAKNQWFFQLVFKNDKNIKFYSKTTKN